MAICTRSHGVQYHFKNGVTGSLQWKSSSYAAQAAGGCGQSVEVGFFCEDGGPWVTKKVIPGIQDDVEGYVTPENAVKYLAKAAKLPASVCKKRK